MTRVEFWQSAGENERYAPGAFAKVINTTVPLKLNGTEVGRCTIVSVTPDDDGRGATWVVDFPGNHPLPDEFRRSLSFQAQEIPERWWGSP